MARLERRPATQPARDLAAEATWLGRTLFVVAAGTVAYWLLALSGAFRPAHGGGLRALATASLAQAFLASSAGVAAMRLLRDAAGCGVHVALASGALVAVALSGLARLLVDGDLSEVSLAVRAEILAEAGGLAIGLWAFSYALRAQRRERVA